MGDEEIGEHRLDLERIPLGRHVAKVCVGCKLEDVDQVNAQRGDERIESTDTGLTPRA